MVRDQSLRLTAGASQKLHGDHVRGLYYLAIHDLCGADRSAFGVGNRELCLRHVPIRQVGPPLCFSFGGGFSRSGDDGRGVLDPSGGFAPLLKPRAVCARGSLSLV